MRIDKDLVAASATPLVLGILADGAMHGYAIVKRVSEMSDGHMQWTDGMLYPLLHRLEDSGYVTSAWRVSEAGRKRKYYSLTPDGMNALIERHLQWTVVAQALRQVWESGQPMGTDQRAQSGQPRQSGQPMSAIVGSVIGVWA